MTTSLTLAIIISTIPLTQLQQAPTIKPMVTNCECSLGSRCHCGDNCRCELATPRLTPAIQYGEGYQMAIAQNRPIITFIGCPIILVKDCISVGVGAGRFTSYPHKCIMVGVPISGKVIWKSTLPFDSPEDEIISSLKKSFD